MAHEDRWEASSDRQGAHTTESNREHHDDTRSQQNGHGSESEFRTSSKAQEHRRLLDEPENRRRNDDQSSIASFEQGHGHGPPSSFSGPAVTQDDDPTTHEVRYTAEVGRDIEGAGGKSLLMAASPQLAQDVRAAFAGVPRVKPQWTDRHLKILVVGESGLGKTTFIKNLLAPYAQDPDVKVNNVSGPEALKVFIETPEKLSTTVLVNDHNSLTSFHYRVQDTPGYNTLEEAREPILEYIKRQNSEHIEREQDAKRANPLHKFTDSRVDVALFFIAPHRLRPLDLDFMVQLADLVPVVPVLAKADSMTVEELRDFRRHVQDALAHAGRAHKKDLLHAFSEEALDAAGARRDAPPFAIVASTTMDLSVGRFWPVRRYPWGTCEALSSVHSDVGALKRLLFEEGYEELKAATEERYYHYRSQQLLNLDDPTLPVRRGTLAEHLYRAVAKPKSGENQRLRNALGKGLKYAVGGAVFYFGVALALGGRERVRADLEKLQEKGGEAAHWTANKAADAGGVIADKAADAGGVIADKAGDVANVTADKVLEAGSSAKDFTVRKGKEVSSVAAEKAGQVKEAVQEKLMSEEELEAKRREEAKKHRWGPFGIFPGGK
ncbi:probable Septin-7 [Coccomyxa sp. Obi]|nr:probable Septin-7 [Coccomyxa sp. Obi]